MSAQMQARYLEGSSLVYRFDPLEHRCVKACYAGLCCRVRVDLSPEPTTSPASGAAAGGGRRRRGQLRRHEPNPTDREHRYQWCRLSRADEVTHHDHKCALECPTPTAHLPEHMSVVPELDFSAIANTNLSAPNDTLADLLSLSSESALETSSSSANVSASRLSSLIRLLCHATSPASCSCRSSWRTRAAAWCRTTGQCASRVTTCACSTASSPTKPAASRSSRAGVSLRAPL